MSRDDQGRRGPLDIRDLLQPALRPPPVPLLEQQRGPGAPAAPTWVPWTFTLQGTGGRSVSPGSRSVPPGGTLTLISIGDQPGGGIDNNRAGVSAPYGPQGALLDLGIQWVHRGQAIPLPLGGVVSPVLQLGVGQSCQVVIDWHEGPPVEWTAQLRLSDTVQALPPWSVDLVWMPDPTIGTALVGAAVFSVGMNQTPGQLVPLDPKGIEISTPGGAGIAHARCRR